MFFAVEVVLPDVKVVLKGSYRNLEKGGRRREGTWLWMCRGPFSAAGGGSFGSGFGAEVKGHVEAFCL